MSYRRTTYRTVGITKGTNPTHTYPTILIPDVQPTTEADGVIDQQDLAVITQTGTDTSVEPTKHVLHKATKEGSVGNHTCPTQSKLLG